MYGFGVVLLELLTGRRSIDMGRPPGEQLLVSWAAPLVARKRQLARLMDPQLAGAYSLSGAQRAAALALECVKERNDRPSMAEVVAVLEELQDLTDWALK